MTATLVILVVAALAAVARHRRAVVARREGSLALDAARRSFSFLESRHGFVCARHTWDERRFGNIVVDFETGTLRIRLVRDRGLWFCYFASMHDVRLDFDLLEALQLIGQDSDHELLQRGEYRQSELFAQVVERNFERLVSILAPARIAELRLRRVELGRELIAKQGAARAAGQS